MPLLDELAEAVGVARHWRNAAGVDQTVSDAPLTAVLGALGYAADNEAALQRSLDQRRAERCAIPALMTAEVGRPTPLPEALAHATRAELAREDGDVIALSIEGGILPPVLEQGYHGLIVEGRELTLAVAPSRCFAIADAAPGQRHWGPAVQVYALRGAADRAYGGFAELAEASALFGRRGASAMSISPVHALYPGDGNRFSPYTPSSRLFLNTAFADPAVAGLPPLPSGAPAPLIDWASALPKRLADLRARFTQAGDGLRAEIALWAERGGEMLRRQALFDALLCRFHEQGAGGWRDWPAAYHDPASPTVTTFAHEAAQEVEFHLFAQWLAERGLEAAQQAALRSGMALGLISDLAVGVDGNGADAWSFGAHMLSGLGIGAPPDPLGPEGQNWCLTTFSPRGLEATGFAPWIAMIRAALAHAGGVRIDHAFGLARLWVVPDGGGAMDGAYVTYPFEDLLRLLALESHRARAFVVAEDLGTAPWGFHDAIIARDMPGMRVLWFERDWDGAFHAARDYDPRCLAMTGTHDTATVAGWWRGTDIDWSDKLGRYKTPEDREAAEEHRRHERWQLWSAVGDGSEQPAPDAPDRAVTAAAAHIAETPSPLAIYPLEDILGIAEQPNIPGTVSEHPNWRRRLSAPLETLIGAPEPTARIDRIAQSRGRIR